MRIHFIFTRWYREFVCCVFSVFSFSFRLFGFSFCCVLGCLFRAVAKRVQKNVQHYQSFGVTSDFLHWRCLTKLFMSAWHKIGTDFKHMHTHILSLFRSIQVCCCCVRSVRRNTVFFIHSIGWMVGTYLMDCTMMMMRMMMMAMAMMREHILFDFLLLFRFLFVTCLELADGNFCTRSFHNENTTMNMTALATNVQFCCYSFNVCSVFFLYASHLYSSLSSNLVLALFFFYSFGVRLLCRIVKNVWNLNTKRFKLIKILTHQLIRFVDIRLEILFPLITIPNHCPCSHMFFFVFAVFSPLYLLRFCYEQWIFSALFCGSVFHFQLNIRKKN